MRFRKGDENKETPPTSNGNAPKRSESQEAIVPVKTEVFMSLQEKRERHKKEKLGETKVEAVTELSTKEINEHKEAPTEVKDSETVQKLTILEPTPEKQKQPVAEVRPQLDTCGSVLSSGKKPLACTPSVTTSMFDLYVNGEECDRMDLNSMLAHMSQYIYAFCTQ